MVIASTAMAHGEDARIDLAADTAPAGGPVQVRLVAMRPGDDVRVELIRPGASVAIVSPGSLAADADGSATGAFDLPIDLEPGMYMVRAIASDGHTVEVALTVQPAIAEGGAAGDREEDDPLLVALPSGWQRSLSSAPVPAAAVTGSSRAERGIDPPVVGLVVIGLLLAGWLLVRSRRPRDTDLP